jgi:hypothetical protein
LAALVSNTYLLLTTQRQISLSLPHYLLDYLHLLVRQFA